MKQQTSREQTPEKYRLSEDWISVLIGFAVVAIVALIGLTSVPWPLFGVLT